MKTLMIDTRQQAGKHDLKENYFKRMGITTLRNKLPVGDYTWMQDMSVVVDTKKDIQEVVGNLIQDHDRFRAEADLAKASGIKFYVLVENKDGVKCLEDIKKWENPRYHRWNKIRFMHSIGKWSSIPLPKRPPTDNMTLLKIMWQMQEKHNVNWAFCHPMEAGAKVIELLGGFDDG